MKKILIAAVGAMALMTAQAQAGNGEALVGGLIGGIIIGGMLSQPHHEHYYGYQDPYYVEQPQYVQRCYTQYRRYWNGVYRTWDVEPVTHCQMEPAW